jgi:hypothetical protein
VQHYEYIRVEKVNGEVDFMLYARPWTQFFDMKGEKQLPCSKVNNVEICDCKLNCKSYLNVGVSDRYKLRDFSFRSLEIKTQTCSYEEDAIENLAKANVTVEFIKQI